MHNGQERAMNVLWFITIEFLSHNASSVSNVETVEWCEANGENLEQVNITFVKSRASKHNVREI